MLTCRRGRLTETTTEKKLLISRILTTTFTLAILAFLFLAFVPVLDERKPLRANEAVAVSSLRVIDASNAAYANEHPQQGYAKQLGDLAGDPHARNGKVPDWAIDPVLASGQKTGYKFTYSAQSTKGDGRLDAFQVTADPLVPGKTGNSHFFIDQTGVFRISKDGPANGDSTALQ
jgi:hypothetical protein